MNERTSIVGLMVLMATAAGGAQYASPGGEVTFPDHTVISVEIADTPESRQRGLMFREHLAANEGMVFLFDESGFYPFWMKNTLIPLDMIWLDEQKRVVSVAHSVPPCKADPCPNFSPTGNAIYVVEVASGFAKKHGVKEGDQLVFKNIGKARASR
jgi:uncharacterized membrane protein (UPF0127 family)